MTQAAKIQVSLQFNLLNRPVKILPEMLMTVQKIQLLAAAIQINVTQTSVYPQMIQNSFAR